MFKSTGNNLKWDGHTSVGQECPAGTYMYIIDVDGRKESGTLMLIR
jgi:hypothetical protein